MSTSVKWTGIDEFREWLKSLPLDAGNEAAKIVQGEANAAAFQIRSRYPSRTGNLLRNVLVSRRVNRAGVVSYVVRNPAKHAAIFEYGTQARHTKLGAYRGSMPPGHVFIPIILQRRRAMYLRLKDLLVRFGFSKVFGDA